MTVYLVGAGPGDPGLITVRGAELVASADVVVYDRLVDRRILAMARTGAELLDVGKRPGGRVAQEEINVLLVARGREGATVVRLKGGDPFVFGRGGEEARALEEAGIAYEVVPGISAAIGVPAYAGIPVTHRGLAGSVTIVTGHLPGDAADRPGGVDWDVLARLQGTLVVLMGAARRDEVAERLIAGGRDPATPVVVVAEGTTPRQRSERTTLGRLGETSLGSPATIVIGEVAGLELGWFAQRPLLGWQVVVTRTRLQASALALRLAALGAVPVELPTIAIADPADGGDGLRAAAARLGGYEWVVFSSTNAVERFFAAVRDARALGGVRVAASGTGTADVLAKFGVLADLVPARFVAEALLEAFPAPAEGASGRVLLPRAAVARDVLPAGLHQLGYEVDVVEAYRTIEVPADPSLLAEVEAADAVTFTSSSTVRAFLAVAGRDRVPPVVACIGPVTAGTAREEGLHVDVEAKGLTNLDLGVRQVDRGGGAHFGEGGNGVHQTACPVFPGKI